MTTTPTPEPVLCTPEALERMVRDAADAIERHDLDADIKHVLGFFVFEHLPPHLQRWSAPFQALARDVWDNGYALDKRETLAGLRKLLEAKDCIVRAAVAR